MTNKLIFPTRRRGATGPTGPQGAGVATLEPRINNLESATLITNIHIDAINGDDLNDGNSSTNPIRTWQRLCEILNTLAYGYPVVRLMSDVTADYFTLLRRSPVRIEFRGVQANGVSGAQRKITLTDATNTTTFPGMIGLYGGTGPLFTSVDVELASSRGFGLIHMEKMVFNVNISSMTLTRTGTGSAVLISRGGTSVGHFQASAFIRTGVANYVLTGLTANSNPNDIIGISSNLLDIGA